MCVCARLCAGPSSPQAYIAAIAAARGARALCVPRPREPGDYEAENTAVAAAALGALVEAGGIVLSASAVAAGLAVTPPCR